MSEPVIEVPAIVRAKAEVDGDGGQGWVGSLPAVLAELEERWSVQMAEPLDGGTSAYVVRARTRTGGRVVVKVAVPRPGFADQVRILELADGRGYVRLLGHDPAHHAVLLEELGPPMSKSGWSPERQLATLAIALTQVWAAPRGDTVGVPAWSGEPVDKAAWLYEPVIRLYRELDGPCPERVLARALQCAEQRSAAFDPDRAVVVHGDAAAANLLQVPFPRPGAESGYVFVDPDPFLGDPAYDLGVALRDWCPELLAGDAPTLARSWSRQVAAATGLDELAIWQWAYLERVSTGLYAMSLTAGHHGRDHLLSAAALTEAAPDQ